MGVLAREELMPVSPQAGISRVPIIYGNGTVSSSNKTRRSESTTPYVPLPEVKNTRETPDQPTNSRDHSRHAMELQDIYVRILGKLLGGKRPSQKAQLASGPPGQKQKTPDGLPIDPQMLETPLCIQLSHRIFMQVF